MSKTIKKTIGEGDASGELYAALAYSATDKFQGMKIKSLMLNEDERIYFRDANTYIYSDASGSLQIVGTTVSVTGTIVPNYDEGFLMTGTSRVSFYDSALYIYSSTDGQLDIIADTVLSLASTDIILTGAIALTGAPTITGNVTITGTVGITGDVTMATSDQINFYDSGASIQASSQNTLAIAATTVTITANTDHTGTFEMQSTGKLQFLDTGLYIYSSTNGQLDVVADTVLALASTDITLTGAIAITGALAMSDDITMATTKKVNFHDTGASIQASAQNTLALTATTAITVAATNMTLTGATSHVGVITMATTSKICFHDSTISINASADGAMAILSDTTLAITCPAITITASTSLLMASTSKIQFLDAGLYIYSSTNGTLDIVADTILAIAATDITVTGILTMTGKLTVGVNDTGYDVQFFTGTSGSSILVDEDADDLLITAVDTTMTGTLTVGINDTGHDVKFYGGTTGAYMLWDEDVDDLILVKSGLVIGANAIGITFNGANTTACISMDTATLANEDHEIEMRNNVVGDKTVICSGDATDDAGIVTAVGADADIADGSLYMSCTDAGGALFIKIDDTWTAVTV